MQKKPVLKTDSDAIRGMKRFPHHDDREILAPVVPSAHPAHLRDGFSTKYLVSDASKEAPEVAAIRDRAGFHTHGKTDHLSYPKGGDPGRIVSEQPTPQHTKGHAHEWGGGIGQRRYIGPEALTPRDEDSVSQPTKGQGMPKLRDGIKD